MTLTLRKATEFVVYLYLFITIMSGSTGDLPVKIIRVVVMGLLVLYFISNSFRIYKSFYCVWAGIFFLYNVVMCYFSFSKSYAIDYTITLFYVVIIDIGICQFLYKNQQMIPNLLKTFIISTIIQSVYVYSTNGLTVFFNSRATETMSANLVGFYCAVSIVFSVYYYYIKERKKRYIASAILCLLFMILSASRKAFIFIVISLTFYLIMRNKNPLKILRNIIIVGAIIVVFFLFLINIPFLYQSVGHRVLEMVNGLFGEGDGDSSTNTRMSLIEFGMTYFWQRPWFGYGMSNFKALTAEYRSWGSVYYAHNNYVELLVDCGVIGTAIYYFLYAKLLYLGIKKLKYRRAEQVIVLGCMIGLLFVEYGMVTYNLPVYQLLLIIFYYILSYDNILNPNIPKRGNNT